MEQITITKKKNKKNNKNNTINNNTLMKFILLKNSFINHFIIKILFISY